MNLALWATIREYIDTEIKLAIVRNLPGTHLSGYGSKKELEEQSTRMETSIREQIANTQPRL
jgi:hypothetical protein